MRKYLIFFILLTVCLFAWCKPAYGAGASIRLYPNTGYASLGSEFSVDIMLDTAGEETNQTVVVLKYDPAKLEVTKAEYGDLYCDYPDDKSSIDNTEGILKITGFCQQPYKTNGEAGLFARITFQSLVEGVTRVTFEYDGSDDEWMTSVMSVDSPPENILTVAPARGTYTVISKTSKPTGPKLPGVGLFDSKWVYVGGGLIGGGVLAFAVIEVISFAKRVSTKRD